MRAAASPSEARFAYDLWNYGSFLLMRREYAAAEPLLRESAERYAKVDSNSVDLQHNHQHARLSVGGAG